MTKLKRMLCLLLSLCMLLGMTAHAELVADSVDDVDEIADWDADEFSEFTFSEETESELSELDVQWETDDSINPNSLDLNENLPDNVINILLIGIDSRSKTLDAGMQRGDVMIVLSVNTETGAIGLTSVMRDLYVTIPGYKSKAKVNTAYTKGGGQLAMRTVNNLLKLNIQHYVVINFYGLASIIDAIGGVDIDLKKLKKTTESRAINAYLKKHPPKYDNKTADEERIPLDPEPGVQHLDGVQAVMYARLREVDNDFNRTARQRNLLEILLKTIMADMSMDNLISLVNTSMAYVKTNMSMDSIVRLAAQVMPALMSKYDEGGSMLNQLRVPLGEDKTKTWKYDTVDGSSVIVFRSAKRLQENVVATHEFIYGKYYAPN